MESFLELDLNQKLQESLKANSFVKPTEIQAKMIPEGLKKRDVLATAPTGTGKTMSYGLCVLNLLMAEPKSKALILTPTRELATQIGSVFNSLIKKNINIDSCVLIGGAPMSKQLNQLRKRPKIIIGTPGRINDHLERRTLKLNEFNNLVLDECDRMLDMGFTPQIEKIIKFLPKHQSFLFSATLPSDIQRLSSKYLLNPVRISIGSSTQPVPQITQEIIKLSEGDKFEKVKDVILKYKGQILIFNKTKRGCDKLKKKLCEDDFKAEAIHGDLRQSKRNRVIENFRRGKPRILVATDVASRGIDIPSISCVVNYHLPQVAEDFLHRIGRTARAGAKGNAVTFVSNNDRQMWNEIQKLINPAFKPEFNKEDRSRSKGRKKFRHRDNKNKGKRFKSNSSDKYNDEGENRRKKKFGFQSDRFNQRNEEKSFSKDKRFDNKKSFKKPFKKKTFSNDDSVNSKSSEEKKSFGFKGKKSFGFKGKKSFGFKGKKSFGFKEKKKFWI